MNSALRKSLGQLADSIHNPETEDQKERRRHYWEDEGGIVDFVTDVIGAKPKSYQVRILKAVQKYRRVAAKSLRGVGKTTSAAWVLLWVMTCAPGEVKAITTASVFDQLSKYLWPEIRKWALKADWGYIGVKMRDGKELLMREIHLDAGQRLAFASSPGDAATIEGAHAETVLVIFDESKLVPDGVFDSIEGAFSTEGTNAFAFAVSTPGAPIGRFYDIHKGKAGLKHWHIENVTLEEAIAEGQVDATWAETMKELWGANDPRYKNQVEGEFADSSEYGVIRLSWVEAAQMRWLEGQAQKRTGAIILGVDPADTGTDKTAIAKFIGEYCESLTYYDEEVMRVVPKVARIVGPDTGGVQIGIDGLGIGAGAFQTLRNQRFKIINLKASARAVGRNDRPIHDSTGINTFKNLRAAMWWNMREMLDPNSPAFRPIALPPDENMTADLVAPEWSESMGVIRIEEKDKIREKLGGRSTDGADAVMMALWLLRESQRRSITTIQSL
jgi:hypothetical protein